MAMLIHPLPPVFDSGSENLVLGSFPSVRSREIGFYYGNERNRFWAVLSRIFHAEEPKTKEEKTSLVLDNRLALWDVVKSCNIVGSADASIKDVLSNDIASLIAKTNITKIFVNGKTAAALYDKHVFPSVGIRAVVLPSTSPANAAFTMEKLVERWKILAAL